MASSVVAVIGDIHGHLQLAFTVCARWQEELGRPFDAVFLCGDIGTFTDDTQLDSATRKHAAENPCELEFLTQWAIDPQAPWLDHIFMSKEQDGLCLRCPVVMVHGNHEGFAHLSRLAPGKIPADPVAITDLPAVDPMGHVRLLPTGWRLRLKSGHCVGGIGGMAAGQRQARYHPMAYIDEDALLQICMAERHSIDLLLTHQGPAATQFDHGAPEMDALLDAAVAKAWCHGHSNHQPEILRAGAGPTEVVPLGDIAFNTRGARKNMPGTDGWSWVELDGEAVRVHREDPPFLRDFAQHHWMKSKGGLLVSPALASVFWKYRDWIG